MKKKFTTSCDELIKNYYGGSGQSDVSNTVRVEELFASYYGKSSVPRNVIKNTPPRVALSLSCDDGETLSQHRTESHIEEYVVQHSTAEAPYEEYVVGESAIATGQSIEASLQVPPTEEVTASQEYQVDILRPFNGASAAAKSTASSDSGYPPNADRGRGEIPAARSVFSVDDTSRAKASEDDFIADMQSILSGQKVFDPATKKTVAKDELNRSTSTSVTDVNKGPVPTAKSELAIFDRIAQSMEYANKYDLGTVELENRFSDFDRISEVQQKAKETKAKNGRTASGQSSPAAVDSADFMQDLDAIRQQAYAPLAAPQSASPSEYSRPFYDTGEHVLAGSDLYIDRLRVGKPPGVPFSYGQIIAMADLYESVDQMMNADPGELTKLKSLIESSTAYYKGNKADRSKDVPNETWDATTGGRYLHLAEKNYEHFSPNVRFKDENFARATNKYGNNKSAWEQHHKRAIEETQKMFLDPQNAKRSFFPEWPLIINGFGDHFLTDAFSAGHMINKETVIKSFRSNFFNGTSLKPQGIEFFEKVAKLAFRGDVAKKFSSLETVDYPVCKWGYCIMWHPDIDNWERFSKVLIAAAEQQTERVGNLVVEALHNRLNKDGIQVFNNAGDGTWTLTGDSYLNPKNLGIIGKAVQQSVDNINDPSIFGSNIDFAAYFTKVWKYVPQLTSDSLKSLAKLTGEYDRPDSDVLVVAAADIIHDQVNSLIQALISENKLKPA